jgi:hypothetical protein
MKTEWKTLNEIHEEGISALNQALGPADAARFLQMYDSGSGDYTAERQSIIGNPTFEELEKESAELARKRKKTPTGIDPQRAKE